MAWGEYQPEYNPKVHGPYDPARWYGKPDTSFGQVKLGELTKWIGRRNMTPPAIVSAMSRSWWRFQHRWQQPRRAGLAGTMQIVLLTMAAFYYGNYARYRTHRMYKYHW